MNEQMKKPVAKDAKGTMKRLMKFIVSNYKWHFCFAVAGLLVSALAGAVGTYFLKIVLDDYIVPAIGRQNPDLTSFKTALVIMAGIYACGIIASYVTNRMMITVSYGTMKHFRDTMFEKMERLPVKYFDTHQNGDIMSHYTNDVDAILMMVGTSLPQCISSAITVVSVFCAMLVLSWQLTVFAVVMLAIMLYVTKKIGGKSGFYFGKQQAAIGKVNGYIEEMISGQKVIKVFNHEEETKVGFDAVNEELVFVSTKANEYGNILMPIMGNLGYVLYVSVAVVGCAMAIGGVAGMTLGTIITFAQYCRNFSQPISQVSMQINSVVMALAGAERIFEIIDTPVEEDNGTVSLVNVCEDGTESEARTGKWAWKSVKDGEVKYTSLAGDIRFHDVVFGYNETEEVLHGINLYAKPGQRIAFVGATGAGKTTITNLINRFYEIQSGSITYDGINIKNIKKDSLRRSLAIVLQDTHLFTGSIMENIRYGNLDATDEEVIAAAKLANADFFVTHLPEGYQTVITDDGENLSQGQRQLLSIARAAVANAPVLIMDEATSSIDTRTEGLIIEGMEKLMTGRTVFVIAHRLSTVKRSNAIMVLADGNIIERGTHDELIAQKGVYYDLYTGKFELD
jgi:ABC-type multidrug transport system, ATPase and permease components